MHSIAAKIVSKLTQKCCVAVGFSLVLTGAVAADTIFGIHAGVNLWRPSLEGAIGQRGDSLDFTNDFSGDSVDSKSLYVAVEHFIPIVPNAMLRETPVFWSGTADSPSGTLGGLIALTGEVEAEFDVDMTDATAYYEVLDNWISWDVGLTLRKLEGFVQASDALGRTDRINLDSTLPMLYGHARFDLPFSGLAAGIRGNTIAYQKSKLVDLEAYLHLEVDLIPTLDVGIQGGVRRLSLNIKDLDDWNSDAMLTGGYIGITAHF